MLIVNTDNIQGKKIKNTLGLVKGNTIREKWFGKDIIAEIRQIFGGELIEYTVMLNESRDQALDRMIEEAKKLKADAILNVRFTTSSVMANAAEILVYGTAVKLK